MKIDGYEPADPHVATEVGVELEYKTEHGTFYIRAKSSGKENKPFQIAAEKLNTKREIRKRTGYKQDGVEALQETLEVWHDNAVMSWSTDVKSGGKAIEATRENFVDVLSMEIFLGVFLQLTNDCADAANFTKEAEEKATKN